MPTFMSAFCPKNSFKNFKLKVYILKYGTVWAHSVLEFSQHWTPCIRYWPPNHCCALKHIFEYTLHQMKHSKDLWNGVIEPCIILPLWQMYLRFLSTSFAVLPSLSLSLSCSLLMSSFYGTDSYIRSHSSGQTVRFLPAKCAFGPKTIWLIY